MCKWTEKLKWRISGGGSLIVDFLMETRSKGLVWLKGLLEVENEGSPATSGCNRRIVLACFHYTMSSLSDIWCHVAVP